MGIFFYHWNLSSISPHDFSNISLLKAMTTCKQYDIICLFEIFLLFLLTFFFSKSFLIKKTYFTNYKLQTNKKEKLYPSLWLLKTNFFCLLPRLTHVLPPTQRLNQIKCQIVLVFKTLSTCCHFLLYIVCFFHYLLKFIPLCF